MKAAPVRSMSASEIAKNVKHFEAWSAQHGLEQAEFSDLPKVLASDVDFVFDTKGKLPAAWVDPLSDSGDCLLNFSPGLLGFLRRAYNRKPDLFSKDVSEVEQALVLKLSAVHLAWVKLYRMKKDGERWSEADFAANVYNMVRAAAIEDCYHRTQCSVHLPQSADLSDSSRSTMAQRVLKAKAVMPDGAVFVRNSDIKHLSSAKESPYKVINAHRSTKIMCPKDSENAFRFQATPCVQLQPTPCFEFASAFWEDKKPGCESQDHAYRQNRMASSSALRHLASLHIGAPITGLLWTDGRVKAHVDWSEHMGETPLVYSAPYPGPQGSEVGRRISATSQPEAESDFYEWDLCKPADIISVFLLIRNLDIWTATTFRKRVEVGVRVAAQGVADGTRPYVPWKDSMLENKVLRSSSMADSENTPPTSIVTNSTTLSTIPVTRPKRKTAGTKAKGPGCSRL